MEKSAIHTANIRRVFESTERAVNITLSKEGREDVENLTSLMRAEDEERKQWWANGGKEKQQAQGGSGKQQAQGGPSSK